MRVLVFVSLLCVVQIDCQTNFWDYSQNFLAKILRQGKSSADRVVTSTPVVTTPIPTSTKIHTTLYTTQSTKTPSTTLVPTSTAFYTTLPTDSSTVGKNLTPITSTAAVTSTITDYSTASTVLDTTTPDFVATTGEPRENPNSHEFYLSSSIKREKPQIKISSNISQVSFFRIR